MDFNTRRIFTLGVLCTVTFTAITGQCPDSEWILNNGRCFLFKVEQSNDHKTWHEALRACKGYNGGQASLVSVHSSEENAFIRDTAVSRMNGGKMHLWIGMSKREFGYPYLWEDGSEVDYVNWAEGEPNDLDGSQPCCRMFEFDGTWDDFDCQARTEWEEYHGYICQAAPASGGNSDCQNIPEAGYPGCCTTGDVFAIIFGLIILAGLVCGILGYLYVYRWDKKFPWQQPSAAPSSFENPQYEK